MRFEFLAFAASAGIIAIYHLYLNWRLRKDPTYTLQAINRRARESWVENIMTTPGKDILAVQTLRNSTMAATFLASTAILLIIGVLNLTQHGSGLGDLIAGVHAKPGSDAHLLSTLKLLMLLVAFFSAFFYFSLAIRMYNHVGYLINSSNENHFCPTPAYVSRLFNRSGRYYTLGMRAYYLSVPLVFWLFGPVFMLVASVGLIVVLYHVDRSPDAGSSYADDAPLFTVVPRNKPAAPVRLVGS